MSKRKASFGLLLWRVIRFVRNRWDLIVSFLSFPELPDDWTDPEKVRLWFIAFMRADVSHELVLLTATSWDDERRIRLAILAENAAIWHAAWNIVFGTDSEADGEKRLTLLQRIRNRIRGISSQELIAELQVDDAKDLVAVIQMISRTFNKNSRGIK